MNSLFHSTLKPQKLLQRNYSIRQRRTSLFEKIRNVICAPWYRGQRKYGVDDGSYQIMDYIDNHQNTENIEHIFIIPDVAKPTHETFHKSVYFLRKTLPHSTLVVGGDHSIAIGSVLGSCEIHKRIYNQQSLCVLWIDAHADINTFDTSLSQNIHGMPLAFCTGIEKQWEWVNNAINNEFSQLPFEHLYYWGIRDVDTNEQEFINKYNIKVLKNLSEVKEIVNMYDHIHTSLDIDGIDPQYMPSTGTPVENGLEMNDVLDCLEYIINQHKNFCIDLVEYNPALGNTGEKAITKKNVKKIIDQIL